MQHTPDGRTVIGDHPGQSRLINTGVGAHRIHRRDVQPTAGVIDNQSMKPSENTSFSGQNAAKRIKGRKHHIITDTYGNLIACKVHTANIQDRDGAPGVIAKLRRKAFKLRHMFEDGGYAEPKLRVTLISPGRWTLQIVWQSDTAADFDVLPRRWS